MHKASTILAKISKDVRFGGGDRPTKLAGLKKALADPKNELASFDPLLLPMLHSELERRRLINKIDTKGGELRKRIIDLENSLTEERPKKSRNSDSINRTNTQRQCEGIKLWVEVSALKNGLESFKTALIDILQNSKKPRENDIRLSYPRLIQDGSMDQS